jgi:hypothetical protein
MSEWRARVFGPEYRIGAGIECLSGSDWAIEELGDGWYMKSAQHQWVENGSLVADEAGGEIISYCFLAARDFVGARRFRPLLPAMSLCGLGGVLSARRIASSRRRAVSSGLYCSSSGAFMASQE